jgi:DNA-binding PadR family transcriptional regulator
LHTGYGERYTYSVFTATGDVDRREETPVSVRNALLALLEQGPRYGYQLRAEFEDRTGGTWPLNVGQVYTTLARLERDGFVEGRAADDDGHVVYAVTARGRDEVAAWFSSPVSRSQPPREELAIKLALAVSVPGVDIGTVIQQQRSATMTALQDYTRLKRRATGDEPQEIAWGLVLDSLVFTAEAEIRWLDHCEARLRRAARDRDDRAPGTTTVASDVQTGVAR